MFWSSILHTYPPLLSQLHGLHLTYLPLTPLTVAAQKVRYRVRHFGRVFTFPVVSAKILIPGVVIGHLDGARSAIFQGFDGFDTRKSQKFFANLLTYPPALRAACGRPLTYLPLTLTSHPTYLSRDRTKRWAAPLLRVGAPQVQAPDLGRSVGGVPTDRPSLRPS